MRGFFDAIVDGRARVSIVLCALVLALAGFWASEHIALDAIPDTSDHQVIVYINWTGQDPQVVQDQATYPIVTTLQHVPHMKTVRGYSTSGFGLVYVLLDDDVDLYWARSRVLEYLDQIRSSLPQDATLNVGLGPDATGVGWVYQYALRSDTRSLTELRSIQDWYLRYGLQAIPGVAEVAAVGGAVKEYQIILDPERLRAQDVPLSDVLTYVGASNSQQGGRWIENSGAEYLVRGLGYVRSKEDLESISLKSDEFGVAVTIKDVGRVEIGMAQRRGAVDLDGEGQVVGGIVVARAGADVSRVVREVKAELERLQESLPADVEVVPVYDRTDFIDASVSSVRNALLLEMLIVLIVVLVFLTHVRSAIAVLLPLPLALLGALLLLKLFDVSLNIMSLSGIAIAIGTMVDAAIVLVENAHKHIERLDEAEREDRGARWRAMLDSLQEVALPILVSLAIIILAFLPVLLLAGEEGRLFRPLVLAKTFAIVFEMALAIFLMPILMAVFIRGRIQPEEHSRLNRGLIRAYHRVLDLCLAHRAAVLVLALVAVVGGSLLYTRLGNEFLPPVYEGELMYMPTTLPGVSISEIMNIVERQDARLKAIPEVKRVFGKAGRAETATDPAPLSMIETIIQLEPRSQWRAGLTLEGLIEEMDDAVRIPGLTNAWTMPIRGRIDMLNTGIKTPVGLKVYGPDFRTVDAVAHEMQQVLAEMPEARSVFADRAMLGRYYDFVLDRDKLKRYNVHIDDAQQVIRYGIGGAPVSTTIEGLERYPITVRYARSARADPDRAMDHALVYAPHAPSFGYIPLYYVADLKVTEAPMEIKTENAMPVDYVYVDTESTRIGEFVTRADALIRDAVELPPGVHYEWSGQYEGIQRAHARLKYVIPLVLLLIGIFYYLLYGKASDTLIVLLSVPFSLLGAVVLMWLLDYHVSVATAVGMLALVGVSAQTAVVMLVYLESALKKWRDAGRLHNRDDLFDAVYEGAVLRLRPKLMTVLTVIFSLLPLMLATGVGANIAKRIAAPLVGGMISSAVLVLLVIPVIYSWVEERRLRAAHEMEAS